MLDFQGHGCSFTRCFLCGGEALVPDTWTGPPDAPSTYVCVPCENKHGTYAIEVMRVQRYDQARMTDNFYCKDCGCVTPDGSAWCGDCSRYDQVFEPFGFDDHEETDEDSKLYDDGDPGFYDDSDDCVEFIDDEIDRMVELMEAGRI